MGRSAGSVKTTLSQNVLCRIDAFCLSILAGCTWLGTCIVEEELEYFPLADQQADTYLRPNDDELCATITTRVSVKKFSFDTVCREML